MSLIIQVFPVVLFCCPEYFQFLPVTLTFESTFGCFQLQVLGLCSRQEEGVRNDARGSFSYTSSHPLWSGSKKSPQKLLADFPSGLIGHNWVTPQVLAKSRARRVCAFPISLIGCGQRRSGFHGCWVSQPWSEGITSLYPLLFNLVLQNKNKILASSMEDFSILTLRSGRSFDIKAHLNFQLFSRDLE